MATACFLAPAFGIVCERGRRPELACAPIALTGNGGLLRVVSEEAERYGICAGQKASGAKALCPAIALLPYDAEHYLQAARGVWDLLAIESSFIEPISPEIAYAEMDGRDVPRRVQALAWEIARQAQSPVQAGLAASKLVARQAALQAVDCLNPIGPIGPLPADTTDATLPDAPAALFLQVQTGREAAFLAGLALDRLPNLDSAMLRRLDRLGVRTLGDILEIEPRELVRQCRQTGHVLRRLAVGEDGDPVQAVWPPRSLEETLRFEVEIAEEAVLSEALRQCAERMTPRLRAGGDYCRALTLQVSLEDGSEERSEERLKAPVSDAGELFHAAERLLRRLSLRQAVVALRLTAGGLGAGTGVQLILLDEHGNGFLRERAERLEAALAFLSKRYGERAVVRAAGLRPKRRIDLWTCALTRTVNERIEVTLNDHGAPTQFWRQQAGGPKRYDVEAIQDRWKEADWFGGKVVNRTAYRIVAGAGLYDLHKTGASWSLGGMAD